MTPRPVKRKATGKANRKVKTKAKVSPAVPSEGKTHRLTIKEADRMFDLYCDVKGNGGFKQIAEVFGRQRATVRALAKREKWDERYERFKRDLNRKNEKNKASEVSDKIKRIEALERSSFAGLFKKEEDDLGQNKSRLKSAPSIGEHIAVSKYADEVREKYGADDSNDMSQVSADVIQKAVETLKAIGKPGLKALGDYIARTFVSPEEAMQEMIADEATA